MRPRPLEAARLAALLLVGVLPGAPSAVDHVRLGDRLESEELPALDGGRAELLSREALANVLVFFRPGQEHSTLVLRQAAAWSRDFAGKPVRIVAIASSRRPREEVRKAAQGAGLRVPVLVDPDDQLYAKLGLRMLPVVAIADEAFRVVAFEPFRKVNYDATIRARIRLALREVDAAGVDRAVNPPRATSPNEIDGAVSHRNVRLGEMLLERGQQDKAVERARHVLARDPRYIPAHLLLGQALAAQGRCEDAIRAFDDALRIEPTNAAALAGKDGCRRSAR